MPDIDKLLIRDSLNVKETLKQMGLAGAKILFVVDEQGRLIGTVSDGDIRRWILRDGSLLDGVGKVYNRSPKYVGQKYSVEDVKTIMLGEKIDAIPVLDENRTLVDVLLWNEVFSGAIKPKPQLLNIPVLVMAGGKGTRMDPFTRILPKPLIPLGEKPVIEVILDNFAEYGCKEFCLTLNYKGKMIQSYFDSSECGHNVRFVWEDKPCGTAGGIRLASREMNAPHFFVSNCDILIKADYHDIYNLHISNCNDITIVGSMKHFIVPYGVLEVKNGGFLSGISEKPEYDFLVNTGMYVVKREVIEHIPEDTKYDFTELIEKVRSNGGKIGVYPVGQHSWVDIGQWQEYHEAIKNFDNAK